MTNIIVIMGGGGGKDNSDVAYKPVSLHLENRLQQKQSAEFLLLVLILNKFKMTVKNKIKFRIS